MNKKTRNALLLLSSMLLASCGGGAEQGGGQGGDTSSTVTSEEDFDPNKEVEVTFWHTMGKTNQDILKAEITEFNKEYPNIKIKEIAAAGGYTDLEDLILKNAGTANLPTMAFCYPDHVAEYLDRNMVRDMSSYVDHATYGFQESDGKSTADDGTVRTGKNDFVKAFWDEGTTSFETAGTFCLPFAKSTEALFYNKDVFDRHGWTVPETWDEMWDLCRSIREAYPQKNDDGDYTFYPLGYDSDSNFFITMCQQYGLDFTTNDLATHDSHFIFNNPGVKAKLTELKGLYDEKLFKTKGTSANATYTSSKFTAGEIFMSIGSTGGTSYNETQNFTVAVAVPPSADANEPAVISQGPSICFLNRASKAQTMAGWIFYRFITRSLYSAYYGLSTGYQPVRYSSYNTEYYSEYLDEHDDLFAQVAELSESMFDSYFSSPVFVGSDLARTEVGKMFPAILLGTKGVQEALDGAMSNCINGTRG